MVAARIEKTKTPRKNGFIILKMNKYPANKDVTIPVAIIE